jgi:Domain of unknown function (DUF5666)
MRRHLREAALSVVVILITVPVFGQPRAVWRTAADVREGTPGSVVGTATNVDDARNQVQLTSDDDRYGQITIVTDSVSTQYNGFGDVINGKPEIFLGSKGFANLREGDRLEVRGVGRGNSEVRADQITLVGRSVPASQTGVGETRSPSSVSTPAIGNAATVYGQIEGVVRQINVADNRIVVETDRREIFNVRTTNNTPVRYHSDTYQIGNLEVGDRIRVQPDGSSTGGREVRARSIEVLQSVQEGTGARVSSVTGRVTRVDRAADMARVDTGRGEVRVDMSRANDSSGRRVRAADLKVDDRVDISGNYGSSSDVFTATTVRFNEDVFAPPSDQTNQGGPDNYGPELVTVTVSGTVIGTLQDSPTLDVKEKATGRIVPVHVTEDFAVRTKSGSYTSADKLNVNDNVLVKAFRDADGNYIAQTIRLR